MRLRVVGFVVTALLTSSVLAQVPSEIVLREKGQALNEADLTALFSGRTIVHRNLKTSQEVPIYFAANGTRYFKNSTGKPFSTPWKIGGGKRCETSTTGAEVCMSAYRVGLEVYLCDPRNEGDCVWLITRSADGDPDGLKP